MSCRFCAIWQKSSTYNWKSDDNVGMCTLNPVWVETKDQHFCSHFIIEARSSGESTLLFHNNRKMHDAASREREERNRRIAVEKISKQLRKQIKILKQKAKT